jgi:hypothetical protein
VRKEEVMLIVNDDHRMRAGVCSLSELCPYCGSAFADYPLIMSDDAGQSVYHVACALELATDLLVDLYTFFSPPAPYTRLFTLIAPAPTPNPEGGRYAINGS